MNKNETEALDIYQEIMAKKHLGKNIKKLNDLADDEDPFAFYVIGKIYLIGLNDIPVNKRKAKKYFNKAYPKLVALADRGNEKAEAIVNSYDTLFEDIKKEVEKNKKAKKSEILPKSLIVAKALEEIEDPVKYLLENKKLDRAIKKINSEIDKNNGYAYFIAGAIKRYGIKDVSVSISASNKLFAKAYKILNEYDEKLAYRMLACIYRDGFGKISKDEEKSLELFAKSSSLGDVKSSVYLAQYYELPEHLDITKSNIYWDIATSQGSTKAVQSLNDEKKDYDHKDITIYPLKEFKKEKHKKISEENKEDTPLESVATVDDSEKVEAKEVDSNKIETQDYDVPESKAVSDEEIIERNHLFVGSVFSKTQKLDIKDVPDESENSNLNNKQLEVGTKEIKNNSEKSLETKEKTILLQDDKDNLVHEAAEENLDVLKKEVLVENKDDKKANIYLLNGIHMLKDTNEERKVDAIKVIKDSAKYGSVRALVLLGYLYEKGITVTQNNSVANEYYNLAIENGSLNAKYRQGLIELSDGKDIGLYKIREAAKQGLPQALNEMGNFYMKGRFGLKDFNKAYAFYRLAAERGDAKAYYNMSIIDRNLKHDDIADENYKKACELGYNSTDSKEEMSF